MIYFNLPGLRQRDPVGHQSFSGGSRSDWNIRGGPEDQHHPLLVPGQWDGQRAALPTAAVRPVLRRLQRLRLHHGPADWSGGQAAEWRAHAGLGARHPLPRVHPGAGRVCAVRPGQGHLHAVFFSSHPALLLLGLSALQQGSSARELGRVPGEVGAADHRGKSWQADHRALRAGGPSRAADD